MYTMTTEITAPAIRIRRKIQIATTSAELAVKKSSSIVFIIFLFEQSISDWSTRHKIIPGVTVRDAKVTREATLGNVGWPLSSSTLPNKPFGNFKLDRLHRMRIKKSKTLIIYSRKHSSVSLPGHRS